LKKGGINPTRSSSNQGGDLIEIEKMDIFKNNEVHGFGNSSILVALITSLAGANGQPMNENQKVGEELQSWPLPTKKLSPYKYQWIM
jgi:glycerol uptake facilitator-like aquaporin